MVFWNKRKLDAAALESAIDEARSDGVGMAIAIVCKAIEEAQRDRQPDAVNRLTHVANVLRMMR